MARYDIPPAEFDVTGARIGIAAARFNDHIVSRLLEAALDTLACHGLDRESIPVARVPGAFELPLAARWLAIHCGSHTDTDDLERPRERRRTVHGTTVGDEHIGEDGGATARSPIPATSAGRGRDDPSSAVQGRRGTATHDNERAGGESGPREKPRAARNVMISGNATADVVIALGAVIRGDTPHFDYVCAEAARGIRAVSLELDVPVVFGVLTCDDHAQALERAGGQPASPMHDGPAGISDLADRSGPASRSRPTTDGGGHRNKGREAALAALEMVSLRRRLGA